MWLLSSECFNLHLAVFITSMLFLSVFSVSVLYNPIPLSIANSLLVLLLLAINVCIPKGQYY